MTTKQKQCLLYYLGYYDGDIDGVWGPKSERATEDLQRANGLTVDGVFGEKTEEIAISNVFYSKFKEEAPAAPDAVEGDWWKNIQYFDRYEFACKCGGKYCHTGFPVEPDKTLVIVADRVREHFDSPIDVSSGVRCSQHNANVGGTSGSRHKSGKAMDFRVRGKSASMVLGYVQQQPEIRYAYAIDDEYVHMDVY